MISGFGLQLPLLYPLTSALKTSAATECDQCCTCWVKVALRRHGPITPPLRWREPGSCLTPGDETDGSSSEHKAPEHLLQSVVPVLNIDRSKSLPRYRVSKGHTLPASQAFFLSSSICSQPPHQSPFPAMNLSSALTSPSSCPVSLNLNTSLAPSCVCDSITLVSSC